MILGEMTIEQLEKYRAKQQKIIDDAKAEFMTAGLILQQRLQNLELTEQKDDLARQQAEIDKRIESLGD